MQASPPRRESLLSPESQQGSPHPTWNSKDEASDSHDNHGSECTPQGIDAFGAYEPVGELLQQQRDQRRPEPEFAIVRLLSPAPRDPSRLNSPVENYPVETRSRLAGSTAWESQGASSQHRRPNLKRKHPSDVGSGHLARETSAEDAGPMESDESWARATLRSRSAVEVTSEGEEVRMGNSAEGGVEANTWRLEETLPPPPPQKQRGVIESSVSQVLLPAEKVFPIQLGSKLFRLSGASITSDAPSYISRFFEQQLRQGESPDNVRTLYIDRDPNTFRDISLHLQGYHIEPRDSTHFVRLFADAQYFSLPRLIHQLFKSTIYVQIGETEFQIPRDLFNGPGDSPNYFSLGFAVSFTTPMDVFPGTNPHALLRPPAMSPPQLPARSARVFADLVHVLKGYDLHVRDEQHRAELVRDARYFHFKGLEQRLIAHDLSFNALRGRTEILVRLEDVRQSSVSFSVDADTPAAAAATSPYRPAADDDDDAGTSGAQEPQLAGGGWASYQRPYADDKPADLVLELRTDPTSLVLTIPTTGGHGANGYATLHGATKARVASLLQVASSKIPSNPASSTSSTSSTTAKLPRGIHSASRDRAALAIRIADDADVLLDGASWTLPQRRRGAVEEAAQMWTVSRAQWRIWLQPARDGQGGVSAVLHAVKIEAVSCERARNAGRGFLA